MDCGVDDTLCHVLSLVFQDNEFATGVLTQWLGETGLLGAVSSFLKDHGQTLVALAGFSFGLYRWWKYREAMLHKRLDEYLRENDRRLIDGQNYVLSAIQRPGPGQSFKLPLFASKALRAVLREQNWDRTFVAANVANSADWQLSTAIQSIERRIAMANRTIGSLRSELATVHVLKGAIASSSKPRSSDGSGFAGNFDALSAFRTALQIEGQQKNLVAKELEAHQLRKLGQLAAALAAYEEVEQLATSAGDYRTQRLTIARAKRYRAEIIQAQASDKLSNGDRKFRGSLIADSLRRSQPRLQQRASGEIERRANRLSGYCLNPRRLLEARATKSIKRPGVGGAATHRQRGEGRI
jgi:hypothetical protein